MAVVCYVEPDLTRVRVLRGEVDEQLPLATARADDGAHDEVDAMRRRASDAAGWLAERTGARVDALCVGVAESVCDWFAAPSPDPAVVAAAASRRETEWDDASPAVSTIQALADDSPAANGSTAARLISRFRRPDPDDVARSLRNQFGVLHTRDGAVRLLLDELDRRGVRVRRTVSLWHAQAGAWADGSRRPASKRVASEETPNGDPAARRIAAVVVQEPAGRVSWSWSDGPELLACGAIGVPTPEGADAESFAGAAPAETAGRLNLEWLAWTAHLQNAPDRIRVVGSAADAVGEHLQRFFPDADIVATESPDPVGATLSRIAAGAGAESRIDAGGRECLVDLTNRPGRAHRRFGVWVAAAMAVLAAGVAGVGFRAQAVAGGLSDQARSVREQLRATIAEVAPNLANHPDPLGALAAHRATVAEEHAPIEEPPPPKPILTELDRLSTVLAATVTDNPQAYVMLIQIDEISASAQVQVPDFATGETLLEQLNQKDGQLRWSSTFPSPPPTRQRLTGQWTEASQ